jgi:Fe2+ or Zn2+ uptake regulation protein
MAIERFTEILREHGLSVTAPRRQVFDALLAADDPRSMKQVIASCTPATDRASVYRTIDTFVRSGIAVRIPIGFTYKYELSEEFSGHHHHFSCVKCGVTVPFESDIIEQTLQQLAAESGFKVRQHQMEAQGLCAACQIFPT